MFFRASTRDVAVPLGIKGHAINLANGDVEVIACGTEVATNQLRNWLNAGPQLAAVSRVLEQDLECSRPERFTTG